MNKKVLLFTLQTFSTTGGIQKMTRTLGHSLNKIAERNNWCFKMFSAYDAGNDLMPQYLPAGNFEGFSAKKTAFVLKSIKTGLQSDVIILSHINLSLIGLAVKIFNPKCRVWLIAHGIEVWRPLSPFKKLLLKRCDKIICVSNFTKQQMSALHKADAAKCVVLNNAVDPFMSLPSSFAKPRHLLSKYHINSPGPVLFTLTRLATTEQYKGHDQVISAVGKIKSQFPFIKYILAGQYDAEEYVRINNLIDAYNVKDQVILTGFIAENELPDHFLLADLFVLPSKKEGFGIVFIEALACGLPVICGNADGSIDAIRNGELGEAIDVDNPVELEYAINHSLASPLIVEKRMHLQKQCLQYFNEHDYINRLEHLFINPD